MFSGVAHDTQLSTEVLARPALYTRVSDQTMPMIAWGRTAATDRLRLADGGRALDATRRFESKRWAHDLFATVAKIYPAIRIPTQIRVDSPRAAARVLTRRAASGATTVVKAEFGVGGHGTMVVKPWDLVRGGGARRVARQLVGIDPDLFAEVILIEDYIGGAGRYRDLTVDAVLGDDGLTHLVGVGLMDIAGTGYRGVTIGPGVVPASLRVAAERFTVAVGAAMAADGYRGWFDVDFVTDQSGRLAPTEINPRLTGPAIAWMIKSRLDLVRGADHLVRTIDCAPLGARLGEDALFSHATGLASRCADLDAMLVVTDPGGGFEPLPYLGIALAARSPAALAAATAMVRSANQDLNRMFDRPRFPARRDPGPLTRAPG
jgi:biotin carboxylase